MRWREILEGLAALPAALRQLQKIQQVGSVQVLSLRPGDVIVIETEDRLSEEGRRNITKAARVIWPEAKVAILDNGFHMRIVHTSDQAQGPTH